VDRDGVVQLYRIAAQKSSASGQGTGGALDGVTQYRTRERAAIPYYHKIEEYLGKELQRFFRPAFLEVLQDCWTKGDTAGEQELLGAILDRIKNRIKNFLCHTDT
jgi:hypothetical protein